MNPSIETRLAGLAQRFEEIERMLADPKVIGKQDLKACPPRAALKDEDASIREMAQEEITDAQQLIAKLEAEIQTLLLPKDPNDNRNIFLEIRAAAGGDESALFAGDLYRMYNYY